MAYIPQSWANLPARATPLSAERIAGIEQGLHDAAAAADAAGILTYTPGAAYSAGQTVQHSLAFYSAIAAIASAPGVFDVSQWTLLTGATGAVTSVDGLAGAVDLSSTYATPATVPVAHMAARDDFARSDRSITGDVAPTGHVWRSTVYGTDAHTITDGLLLQNAQAGGADIDYLDLGDYGEILSTSFVFDPTPGLSNVVLGCCPTDFGAGGSIQFCVFTDHWQVEVHPIPAVTPYPIIVSGIFNVNLIPGVRYLMAMRMDRATSNLTLSPPASGVATAGPSLDGAVPVISSNTDGTRVTVAHKDIAPYWGQAAGAQCRHPGPVGDGQVRFAGISAQRAQPVAPLPDPALFIPNGLRFDGSGNGWLSAYCSPASWTVGANLEQWALFAPDTYAGNAGASQSIFNRWETNNYSHRLYLSSTKKLVFQGSTTGTTTGTADICPVALTAADGDWTLARAVRVGNDGSGNTTTAFYTGNAPGETLAAIMGRVNGGTVVWTQLGTTVTRATGGETCATIDGRWRLGADGTSTPAPFKGRIAFVKEIDNSNGYEITRCDLSVAPWFGYALTAGTYLDGRSHRWTRRGMTPGGVSWAYKIAP